MARHLTPIQVCERLIAPIEEIGPICGDHAKTAYNWRYPSGARDAGDIPSARKMRRLLAYAAARGIPLTADHLIWGAPEAEIEALTAAPAPEGMAAE